ncbi:MAG TPA: type II secretion system F family protein [Pseudolabrys sp.]|nr:type II secretion system F family protein [Pseudolabrys sp.]
MTRFRYKAVTSKGDIVEGALEAPSRSAVIDRLRRQGHLPIRAEALVEPGQIRWWRRPIRLTAKLTDIDVILFTRQLATLLQARLPIDRALGMRAELEAEGPRRTFVRNVLDALRGGAPFADALVAQRAALPPFYVGMVRAGEAGNTLDSVLARLADALERTEALREGIRSAMYYPAIVLFVAAITLVVLLTAVVPEFKPLFEESGVGLPLPMAVLLGVSDFLAAWWWALIAMLVGGILVLRYHNQQPAARLRWDRWLIRLPLLRDLLIKIEVARFSRTLGTLLANGVTALPALSIAVGAIGNREMGRVIELVSGRLQRGEGLALPLRDTGLFPPLAAQLVQVGEDSGQLEPMLLKVAEIYDEEVKRTLQRLMTLLVPVVTIGLGLLVAGIIATMLGAILSTYELSF